MLAIHFFCLYCFQSTGSFPTMSLTDQPGVYDGDVGSGDDGSEYTPGGGSDSSTDYEGAGYSRCNTAGLGIDDNDGNSEVGGDKHGSDVGERSGDAGGYVDHGGSVDHGSDASGSIDGSIENAGGSSEHGSDEDGSVEPSEPSGTTDIDYALYDQRVSSRVYSVYCKNNGIKSVAPRTPKRERVPPGRRKAAGGKKVKVSPGGGGATTGDLFA